MPAPPSSNAVVKPLVGLDLDETLACFLPSCNEWYNRTYNTSFSVSDYKSYLFSETWNCSYDESMTRIFEFFKTSDFENLLPVPGAVKAIQELSTVFDLAVVTSRQSFIREQTLQWLDKTFGLAMFKHIMFGNQWLLSTSQPQVQRTKADMCRELGAVALVDDLPDYIIETADYLSVAVLFNRDGVQNWSRVDRSVLAQHPNIRVAETWPEISEILMCSILTDPHTSGIEEEGIEVTIG